MTTDLDPATTLLAATAPADAGGQAAVHRALSRTEVFAGVPRVRVRPGDPDIRMYTCVPVPELAAHPRISRYLRCGGAGFSDETGWLAAVGEGLERYAAVRYSAEPIGPARPWGRLPGPAPHPSTWCLFSADRYEDPSFPCRPFGEDTLVRWCTGTDLLSGEPALLPAPLVCLPYRRAADETRIAVPTSTGLAFAADSEGARLAALLEVVERDAVVLAWHWGLPAVRIRPDDAGLMALTAQAGLDERYDVRAFALTSDIDLPTAMVFIRLNEDPRPLLAVGSACRPSLRRAVEKAFLEAAHGVSYVRSLCRTLAEPSWTGAFDGVRSFQHSAIFHTLFPEHLTARTTALGDVLVVDGEAIAVPDQDGGCLGDALRAVAAAGFRPYAVDLTPAAWSDTGCTATRVLVPGLAGLEGAYRYRSSSTDRATGVAERTNCELTPTDLPHPLP